MCQYLSSIGKSGGAGQYDAEVSIQPDTSSVSDSKSVNYKITNSKNPTTQLAALRRRLHQLIPAPGSDQKEGIHFVQQSLTGYLPGKVPVTTWDALYTKLVRSHTRQGAFIFESSFGQE